MLLGVCWWGMTVASGRKWLEEGERAALVEACRKVDPGQKGRIPISAMGKVLGDVGFESAATHVCRSLEVRSTSLSFARNPPPGQPTIVALWAFPQSLVARAERTLVREREPSRFGDGDETVAFSSLVGLVAESFRLVRQPFGGKRCIVSRLPLPACCENGYCIAHLEKPSSAALSGRGGVSDENLKRTALKMIFAQHDTDGSGAQRQYQRYVNSNNNSNNNNHVYHEMPTDWTGTGALEMEELPKILAEFDVEYDEKRLPDMFAIYDVDDSGALDFEEFSALLKDMKADNAVAEKKMNAYRLPPTLLKEFSPEAIEEMRVTFARFDESGDGALDEEELGALLRTFGQEPTKDKIHKEMLEVDYDRSGTIEFKEFVTLMKKVRDGEVELDDSAFGRAIMNSTVASRLSEELRRLDANPIPCLQSAKVFHLNFSVLLDGTTAVRSVLDQWTAEWNVAKFLREVIRLLRDPDPSLLPDSIRRGASKTAAAAERLQAPSNASRRSPKVEKKSQGGGFGEGEEKDQGSDERHHEGTGRHWREREGWAGVNEGRCHHSSIVEGRHPAVPPEGKVRGGAGGVGPQGAFGSVASCDTTNITRNNRGGRGAGEGVLPEHEMPSPNRAGRENKRHERGDDLRETKWGDLVSVGKYRWLRTPGVVAVMENLLYNDYDKSSISQMSVRVASLWYDNRPLYEQTARRIAATQAEGNRS
ncbi:unnamed protein product [Ectocarpus sp. CCAP 1310/34]|nr:unnamed protein product [Ectocarpus sp. CCAP 1310/34]